jgi:hypothetical protein
VTTVYASRPHYAEHLAPVAALLPDLDIALVASYADVCKAREKHKRIVLMQHGIGQSYSDDGPAYPGGRDNDAVGLFLVPNNHAGQRWRSAYPAARVEVVGSPRLDDLPRREPGPVTVAVTFHWRSGAHEKGNAFDHYKAVLPDLARRFHVIGHGHPRATRLPAFYAKHGIEFVPSFADVCRRADLLIADNTSALFEFAATGRPVVVMNSPAYRRDVWHGLRFWQAATVGVNVEHAEYLLPFTEAALEDHANVQAAREAALSIVFAFREGAAQRAADAIVDWAA